MHPAPSWPEENKLPAPHHLTHIQDNYLQEAPCTSFSEPHTVGVGNKEPESLLCHQCKSGSHVIGIVTSFTKRSRCDSSTSLLKLIIPKMVVTNEL